MKYKAHRLRIKPCEMDLLAFAYLGHSGTGWRQTSFAGSVIHHRQVTLPSCPGRFLIHRWIQNARAIGGGVDDKKCVIFDSPIQQHRTGCFVLLNRYKQDALTLLKGSFSFGVRQTMKKARKKRALKVNV